MDEQPQAFASAAASLMNRPDRPRAQAVLKGMLEQHRRNQQRRSAVLEHDDLRKRLEREAGYDRADNWNGYIPPEFVNEFSGDELARSTGPNGSVRMNQLGRYGQGQALNDSPVRAVLLEISQAAWDRRAGGGGTENGDQS